MALCLACRRELADNARACARCAEPLAATAGDRPELTVCGGCLWHPPPYRALHVPYRYAPPLDWMLHRFKFSGDLVAGKLLGELLAHRLHPMLGPIDAIVPIPLHPRRLRERGYNQAAELARPLARRRRIPVLYGALARGGSATPQMQLPARQRRANVDRAFALGARPPSGHVLLIDDVVTTASTMRAAARTLTAATDTAVTAAALARA